MVLCVFLLCTFTVRKSRADSLKKALTEMSAKAVQRSRTDSLSINEEFLTKLGTNELHVPNKDLNDFSNYNNKVPILCKHKPNLHHTQRNSVPTIIGRAPGESLRPRMNSSPPILLSRAHTVDPMTGQVIVQMMPQTPPMIGIPGQMIGLKPQLSGGNGYIVQMYEEEGGKNEMFTDEIVMSPSGQIFTQRDQNRSKSLSRGHDSRSSQRTNHRESTGGSIQKKFTYIECSQRGPEQQINYLASSRKNKKKRKRKRQKSTKRKLKKSFPEVRGLSSSEEEIVHTISPNGSLLFNWIPEDQGVSEADGEMQYSSREELWSQHTVSAQTPTSASVLKLKQPIEPWSEEDIVMMVKKELQAERQLLMSGKEIDQAPTEPTQGLGSTISKEIANSGGSVSETMSKSTDIVPQSISSARKRGGDVKLKKTREKKIKDEREDALEERKEQEGKGKSKKLREKLGRSEEDKNGREDAKAKLEKPLVSSTLTVSLESIYTSSSDDSKASSGSEEDALQVSAYPKHDSFIMAKMKEVGIDLVQANMKIPKNFEELKVWQKSMLDTVAHKYFDKEFLDGGVVPSDMGWPSRLNSPSEVESSQSGDEFSSGDHSGSESSEKPAKDLESAKEPSAVSLVRNSEQLSIA